MNSRELEVLSALAILAGTLVIGANHFSAEPIGNHVRLIQHSGSAGSGSGMTNTSEAPTSAVDVRDNSRMDSRQASSAQGVNTPSSRIGGSTNPPLGPFEYDSRRLDNSRMDSRSDDNIPVTPDRDQSH